MRQVLYAGLTPPSLTHHGFLVLIRLDASYEEWIALAQSLHEGLQHPKSDHVLPLSDPKCFHVIYSLLMEL